MSKSKKTNTKRVVGGQPPGNKASQKQWLFRIAAAFLVPLAILCLMELVLLLVGSGYPTRYFIEETVEGRTVLRPNEDFSRRFFPGNLVRSPNVVVFDKEKKPGALRIFVFGESAALGDPRPGFGFHRYLEALLSDRYPQVEFEVICVAMTAINSHAVLPIARECADLDGDLWIVYMGNNEMVGPFGVSGVLGASAPSGAWVRANLALKRLKLVQKLTAMMEDFKSRERPAGAWEGLKMFLDHPVPPKDPRKKQVYVNFKANYHAILQWAEKNRTPVIASSVISAVRDFGPFASHLNEQTTDAAKSEVEALLHPSPTPESERETALVSARSQYPEHAGLAFALGRLDLLKQRWSDAKSRLFQARDLDAIPLRSDSNINQTVADLKRLRHPDCSFFDVEKWISDTSPAGMPGSEIFFDHVHFNFLGNYLIALGFADQAQKALAKALPKPAKEKWLDQQGCETFMGLTAWNKQKAYETMIRRLETPPFTQRLSHSNHVHQIRLQLAQIHDEIRPDNLLPAQDVYEEAIAKRPHDFRVREAYAEFLESTGDAAGALEQWTAIKGLLPFHFGPYYHVGRFLRQTGRVEEALDNLETAKNLRPESIEIGLELNQCLAAKGETRKALSGFQSLEKDFPERSDLQFHMAQVYAQLGNRTEAVNRLEKAIDLSPGNWQARYLLGVELAIDDKIKEAADQFIVVTELNPNFALAHFNLGNAYARVGMLELAQKAFTEALRLDPQNGQALERLRTVVDLLEKNPSEQ